jgi:O-antigen/teichoic acid export membrane protein
MNDNLYRNSIFLIANTAASAVLGFGFWAVAAHIYHTSTIGIVTAIIAASSLIASLSYIGLDYALIKFIPRSRKSDSRANTGLTIAAGIAVILSAMYLLIVPIFVQKLNFLVSSPIWSLGFVLLVVLSVWNTLTNSIFVAHRIIQYALIASIVVGVVRFPLLYVFRPHGTGELFGILLSSLTLGVVLCFVFLKLRANYLFKLSVDKAELKYMRSYAFGTYLSNVIGGLPSLVTPMILLKMVGVESVAYFYMANMIGSLLYIIPNSTGQVLLAEGNWDIENLSSLLWRAAKLIGTLVIIGMSCVIILGWKILGIFGGSYQHNGYLLLVLLAITGIPKIASYLFSTVLRIHNRIKPIVVVATIGTIIQLSVSIVGLKVSKNLAVLGVAAILCEIFVATAYTYLFLRYKKQKAFDIVSLSDG